MKKLTEYTMEDWQKISLFISIISGSLTIITIIPIWLGLYFKFPFFYNLVQFQKIKTFNLQGYVLYRPVQGEANGKNHWFLISNREDNSPDSIKTNDILVNSTDGNVNLRYNPTDKSRSLFYIKEGQCVIVLSDKKKNVEPDKNTPSPEPGVWLNVALTACPTVAPN